jgi:hypothetical protein
MILEQGYNAAAASLDQGVVAPGLLLQVEGVTREGEYGGPLTGSTGLYAVDGVEVPYGSPGGPLGGSSLTGPVPDGGGGTDPDPGPEVPDFGILLINPNEFPAGYPSTGATVSGAGFQDGAVVVFDGADMATDFISDNQLNFMLPSEGASVGTVPVVVRNPGGELTAEESFTFIDDPMAARQVSEGPLGIVSIYRRNGKLVITVADPIRVLPGTIITIEASGSSSVNGQYEVEEVNGNEVVVDSDFQLEKPIEGKGRLISQS